MRNTTPNRNIELLRQEFSQAQEYAAEYEGSTPQAHYFNTRLKRVEELLREIESGRVLAVGCGPSKSAELFRGRPIHFYGVDISEGMIAFSRAALGSDPQFHFSIAQGEDLPFRDSYFDAVMCLGAFEYMADKALTEITRVAKPGGVVILSMHNLFSPYRLAYRFRPSRLLHAPSRLMRILRRRNHQVDSNATTSRFHVRTERRLRQMFHSERLKVEDVIYYDFNLFVQPLDVRFPRAAVRLSNVLERFGRSRIKRLGSGFIIKGRKVAETGK